MKRKQHTTWMAALLLCCSLLGCISCEDRYDLLYQEQGLQEVDWSRQVQVSIPIKLDKNMTSTVVTRAGAQEVPGNFETQVSGIMVFVYSAVAPYTRVAWHLFANPNSTMLPDATGQWIKDPANDSCGRLVFNLPVGDVYIYILANAQNSFLTIMPRQGEDWLSTQPKFLRNIIPTWTGSLQSTDGYLPMTGQAPNQDALCHVAVGPDGKTGVLSYYEGHENMTLSQRKRIPISSAHEPESPNHRSFALTRMLCKVSMKIKATKPGATFTPRAYKFFHVSKYTSPSLGLWDEHILDSIPVTDTEFFAYSTQSPDSFSVFLPPNNRKHLAVGPTTFHQRDEVVKDANGLNLFETQADLKPGKGHVMADHQEHYKFKYAPMNSTYVEIFGEYEEPSPTTQNKVLTADTRYIVHLGDFRTNFNSYDLVRNHHYNYTVKVNGVRSIDVEVGVDGSTKPGETLGDEINPAMEGIVFKGGRHADVDAHYEQVEMRFSRAEIPQQKVFIYSTSPFGTFAGFFDFTTNKLYTNQQQEIPLEVAKKYFEWVKFRRQTARGVLAPYKETANGPEPMDIFSALKDFSTSTTGEVYYTCFVDEFYYEKNPMTGNPVSLSEFVNKRDRVFAFASKFYNSKDRRSAVADAIYVIHQRSISSFYDLAAGSNDPAPNKFGVETFTDELDELHDLKDGITYGSPAATAAPTGVEFGWSNTCTEIGIGQRWDKYINVTNTGYSLSDIGFKLVTHATTKEEALVKTMTAQGNAYYACLTRNRDLNGNGLIDEDELRWYTPSRDQLLGLWIGEEAMPNRAALYPGNTAHLSDILKNETKKQAISTCNVFSSSNEGNRRIWADQGCSFGSDTYSDKSGRTQHVKGHIRAVRNLGPNQVPGPVRGSQTKTQPSDFYERTPDNKLKAYIAPSAMRKFATRELEPHHERSTTNRLYPVIEFATKPYTKEDTRTFTCPGNFSHWSPQSKTFTENYMQTTTIREAMTKKPYTLAQEFEKVTDPYGATWRLPNQRELALLVTSDLYKAFMPAWKQQAYLRTGRVHKHGIFSSDWVDDFGVPVLLCRTHFSNSQISGNANYYTQYGFIYNVKDEQIQLCDPAAVGEIGGYFCVRDVRLQ